MHPSRMHAISSLSVRRLLFIATFAKPGQEFMRRLVPARGKVVQFFFSIVYSLKLHEKVCFSKPCTSAVSESEFDNANRILRLKVGVLVYTMSRLSKCQG